MSKIIEIPFGAKDSENKGWEYTIPAGMEAVIEDGKVIVREKESEDERIRNEIYNFLIDMECKEEWINYLEKQKEQKPRKFKVGDKVHLHGDDTNVITITGFRDDAYLTYSAYGPILFSEEDDWEIVEQQPAEWSEEDSIHLKNAVLSAEKEWGTESCTAKWLKSLPERFNLQPKQEWSKEDKKLLDFWSDVIDRNDWRMDENFCKASREFINRLKSLHPSWKPSEEQMKEYSYWYKNFIESGLASPTSKAVTVLGELLEQLKKL